ncbi:ferritin-like domain-containing protein [Adhaeribacter aquaticus]|uniref:ferritin-like domain-containing protein n=1 Tax=Adhaeribacter aquaticus TaxID=299567 RepID=UPI0003F694A9|nr:ferritin-like domain-containing protein [Adhaeribacter aquaticus]
MNILNIITEIQKVDPEVFDRLDSRRKVFQHFAGFGKKLAATAVPLAFGSMLNKAYGQTSADIVGVLNFALTLEHLEAEFYKQAVTAAPAAGAPAIAVTALTTIRDHEVAHVNALRSTITSLGGTPVALTAANFDFTAKGAVPTVFTNYGSMLAVAQAFEDTGVRAYKGQAGNLVSNNAVLEAALRIHSVEARHAAHIRRMRRDTPAIAAQQKPWITMKDRGGLPAFTQGIYDGEELTTQANVPIAGTFGTVTVSANAASEAFDEPLTREQVLAIVQPFIRM